jgi:hypothetical protein
MIFECVEQAFNESDCNAIGQYRNADSCAELDYLHYCDASDSYYANQTACDTYCDGVCTEGNTGAGDGDGDGSGGSSGAGSTGGGGMPITIHCTRNSGEAETGACVEDVCFHGADTEQFCLDELAGRFICDQSASGLGPCPTRDSALAICEDTDTLDDKSLPEYNYRSAIIYTQETCNDMEGEKDVGAVCDGASGTLTGPQVICTE